eukprot:6198161-Pleurochrysis_carterae.AAC.5
MPNANAEGEGRGAGACDTAFGCAEGERGREQQRGEGWRQEAEKTDLTRGCASRSAFAMTASLPEGPGWTSTSPARGSRSTLQAPCSGMSEPRKSATSGGTWRCFACIPSRAQRA